MLKYLGENYHDICNWFSNGSANVYPYIWEREREMANMVNWLTISESRWRAHECSL